MQREPDIKGKSLHVGEKVSGLPTYASNSAFDFHNEDLSILYTKSGCTWSKCRENLKRQKPAYVGQKFKDCRRICPILISFSLFSYWSLCLLDTKSWTWTKCRENLISDKAKACMCGTKVQGYTHPDDADSATFGLWSLVASKSNDRNISLY